MAISYKMALTFKTTDQKSMTVNIPYANPNASGSSVKTVMQAFVTNGSMFKNVPAEIVSATVIQTTTTDITIPA